LKNNQNSIMARNAAAAAASTAELQASVNNLKTLSISANSTSATVINNLE
jgi:hypothetical protein